MADFISSVGSKISEWGSNASKAIKSTGEDLAKTATGISKKFSDAFSNSSGFVTKQTDANLKPLTEVSETAMNAYKNVSGYDLFPIGRPCKFNDTVDKYQRFGNYLRSKMSVIDLIPVDYGFDFTRMAEIVGLSSGTSNQSDTKKSTGDTANMFNIGYKDNIAVFKRLCAYHGLDEYAGIRLYTTDDTTANDTIQISYKDSSLQGAVGMMSEMGQQIKDLGTSLFGTQTAEFQKKVTEAASEAAGGVTSTLGGSELQQRLAQDLAHVASDLIIGGNKMTFPKIWQSTTYSGNLSVNIRLVSPYGHPKAVKEFILKPLSYLLLLAAPQTTNGVTYGKNIPVTIKAYGLNYTIIGALSSITFRRGGSDTSFNLYKQPLTIDISIDFQTLFDAFAVFDPGPNDNPNLTFDRDIFDSPGLGLDDPNNLGRFAYDGSNSFHMMNSLGMILSSLKPIGLFDAKVNPQVYGLFSPPVRDDIPDTPAFIPVTGNLGSSISSAVDSIGAFGKMITNAPKLLQQGLSNAVYNTAKGSVSSILGKSSKYINNVGNSASKVVNTVHKNLF